ncbi:hypothetical protein [Trueperella sp. LYQ143]|uniref:hypothetical protein n=1 Tax=Trueperella sp. LYQ143 TaxID=3391059 RepID=UPI0039839988
MKVHQVLSLVLAVLCACVSVFCALVVYGMNMGEHYYRSGRDSDSAQAYRVAAMVFPDRYARWDVLFGYGTAQLRAGAIEPGVETLRHALAVAPTQDAQADHLSEDTQDTSQIPAQCQVRINLSIGLEMLGDDQRAAGRLDQAISTYREASVMVEKCSSAHGQAQEQRDSAHRKQQQTEDEKRQRDAGRSSVNVENPSGHSQNPTNGSPQQARPNPLENMTDEQLRQQELQRRTQEALRAHRQRVNSDFNQRTTGDIEVNW